MSNTDSDLSRAEAFGRHAARNGQAVTACPYEANGDEDQRELATRYVRAYYEAEPTRKEHTGKWTDSYR